MEQGKKRRFDAEKVFGPALGLLDPVLQKWAIKIAELLPANWGRSDVFQSIFGVLKGFLESISKASPLPVRLALEKATDIGDFLAQELRRGKAKEIKAIVEDWMEKFFNDAGLRLEKAKAEDLKAEFEKIKLEFTLRNELLKLIEESKPKEEPVPVVEPVKWQEIFKKLKTQFNKVDTATASVLQKVLIQLAERGIKS